MEIILSRHGNTFGPGDKVVWTGATNDIPLVEKGLEQAASFADALGSQNVMPAAIYCGPLQRARKYAETIVERLRLSFAPIVDNRITEIDYGDWTGLSNDEVVSKFGREALEDWDKRSVWPKSGKWRGSPASIALEVQSFVKELEEKHSAEETIVVVSSNGRLRYFLTLVPNELERRIEAGSFKVKTGNICKLISNANGTFSVPYWNSNPADIERI